MPGKTTPGTIYIYIAQLFLESIESAGNHLVNTSRSRGPYLFLCLCHRSLTAGRTMWLFGRMRDGGSQDERPLSFPTRCDDISRSELAVATGALEEEQCVEKTPHVAETMIQKQQPQPQDILYLYEIQIPDHNYKKEYKWFFFRQPKTSLGSSTTDITEVFDGSSGWWKHPSG